MSESEARTSTDQPENEGQQKKKHLKYLDFVQVAALYVIVYSSTMYQYAKENSGPLRPGVQTVEGTVKAVIGPVYQKFHSVPFQLLKFVDRKVDESITKLDRHVPLFLKQLARETLSITQKAPETARELAAALNRDGPAATGKELYAKYEPVAERFAVSTWRSLNRLPLFPHVAHIVVPTAAYWAEKYNQVVGYAAERGYAASYYLPLVPIERIAKAFEGAQ